MRAWKVGKGGSESGLSFDSRILDGGPLDCSLGFRKWELVASGFRPFCFGVRVVGIKILNLTLGSLHVAVNDGHDQVGV